MRNSTLATFAVAAILGYPTPAAADPKPDVTWVPANSSYYGSRGGGTIQKIVIHTIEGSAQSGINTFRSGRRRVRAHYIVDYDGSITQMVRDRDNAWHAGRVNRQSIGIEHAGFAGRNNWTDAQYRASARLSRWLCDTYAIPKDRQHIIAHSEAPGATHGDPGRYFDWDYYIRLIRGEDLTVQPIGPAPNQKVGAWQFRRETGTPETGYSGLRIEWALPESATQTHAEVQLREVGGPFRYASGRLTGSSTTHLLRDRLQHGRGYEWRVRIGDGSASAETPWVRFGTDFTPPRVTATAPVEGATVYVTPVMRWRYEDADGPQVSYRIYLDDDEDHTRIIGDTKERNGATAHYFLRSTLQPGKTYYWRVMGYDGHGNVAFSDWMRFTTSRQFQSTPGEGITVTPLSPGSTVLLGTRPLFYWAFHNGKQRDQSGFRIQIEDASTGRRLVDDSYDSSSRAYRGLALPLGSYRWRVGASDGQESGWTTWRPFQVTPAAARGLIEGIR